MSSSSSSSVSSFISSSGVQAVQATMEAIAQGYEPKEELMFNPVTGELEAIAPAVAATITTKPTMTRIARDGFFLGNAVAQPQI